MQFYKKTRSGPLSSLGKFLVKIIIIGVVLLMVTFLVDKIDFPSPNKKIEKIVPNENFKVVK